MVVNENLQYSNISEREISFHSLQFLFRIVDSPKEQFQFVTQF